MKEYEIVQGENKRPTTRIEICGFEVLALDVNSGWEITKVIFDDKVPVQHFDELTITIKKRQKGEEDDKQGSNRIPQEYD